MGKRCSCNQFATDTRGMSSESCASGRRFGPRWVISEREGRLSIRNGTSLYETRMASTRIVITQDQSRPLNPNPSPNGKPKFARRLHFNVAESLPLYTTMLVWNDGNLKEKELQKRMKRCTQVMKVTVLKHFIRVKVKQEDTVVLTANDY